MAEFLRDPIMKRIQANIVYLAILLSVLFSGSWKLLAQDWTSLRGNDGLGSVQPEGILSKTSEVDLRIRWKAKIGSGYSSPVISNGFVITLYTSNGRESGVSKEKEDFVAAFDAGTGVT